MTLNFFTIVSLFSVFLSAVLSLFFFVTKKGISTDNKILALLLGIFNLQIIYSFATSSYTFQYFLDWHKSVFALRMTSFLIGPLIYFYIQSFLKRREIITSRSLFHLLPFAFALVFLMIFYGTIDRFIIWESELDLYFTLLILAHYFVYIVLSVWSMKSMHFGVRDFFKRMRTSSHNTWLQALLLGFIAVWIANLNSFALYMIIQKPGWCAFTASIFALVAFLFVNAIMFMLLMKPEIYYVIEKYKHNKITDAEKKEYLRRLQTYMETDKAYLNPDISIELVANAISVNPRILSQIINETFGKNFRGYVLEFRLRESMQKLADPNYREHTILEILYQVGFNNKSAFNNQFKLHTNLTPQEYRAKFVS